MKDEVSRLEQFEAFLFDLTPISCRLTPHAGMAELVDAHDSKSCGVIHGSSILPPGTDKRMFI